jgi:hypothetical protein
MCPAHAPPRWPGNRAPRFGDSKLCDGDTNPALRRSNPAVRRLKTALRTLNPVLRTLNPVLGRSNPAVRRRNSLGLKVYPSFRRYPRQRRRHPGTCREYWARPGHGRSELRRLLSMVHPPAWRRTENTAAQRTTLSLRSSYFHCLFRRSPWINRILTRGRLTIGDEREHANGDGGGLGLRPAPAEEGGMGDGGALVGCSVREAAGGLVRHDGRVARLRGG